MIIPPVTELSLVGVSEPGVANHERIVLRPTEPTNLAQFGIFVGYKNPNGPITPLIDNFFWFGELVVEPPSWIVVYTGPGQYQQSTIQGTGHLVHSLHWGRPVTLFNHPSFVPVLFRMDAILIGQHLINTSTKQLTR